MMICYHRTCDWIQISELFPTHIFCLWYNEQNIANQGHCCMTMNATLVENLRYSWLSEYPYIGINSAQNSLNDHMLLHHDVHFDETKIARLTLCCFTLYSHLPIKLVKLNGAPITLRQKVLCPQSKDDRKSCSAEQCVQSCARLISCIHPHPPTWT